MKTRTWISAIAISSVVALTGCAGGGPTNQQLGTVGGAVIGGAAGNAIGGGNAFGTVGGAAAGALIGNEVGRRSDQRRYYPNNGPTY
ncbi:glycine zipper 2TM domain-containing protein [Variovorax sp. J22R133]|uniref:glycine zipper 2TM domain-containing protein n=1 Tax=Variovorax brevis TaxID=3053503 RepID=UPI0025752563|nr:glycine zipper 2TM domain-containing protein [Variovorax sp. J22R133]MDM0113252.1 glycine zipper 2TM domain-containing protein [Variovorax sp. J22R133]